MGGVAGVLLLWQIASLVYPMTWSFYCIAQLGWSPAMIGASLAFVGVAIALGQTFVVGPMVARFGERDAATIGLAVAVAIFVGSAFVRTTWGAFLFPIPVAFQSPVKPSTMAMMSRLAGADLHGECPGIPALTMGLGPIPPTPHSTAPKALFP